MRYLSSAFGFSLLGVIVLGVGISISNMSVFTLPEQLMGQSSSDSSLDSTGGNKPSPPRGSDRRQDT
jgi:hypothetical protein